MGTVTIGVSIAVPEPHGSLLQERRAGFGDAAAHGIPSHVTLLPPTEVEASALPAVEAHLTEVAAAGRPFPMRLSGTGTFRPLSPVVYVRVVEGVEACGRLQQRVRDASGPLAR
ncbi:2'-5' RNA ligase family protein, partial [Streptomyces sp. NPDC002920]